MKLIDDIKKLIIKLTKDFHYDEDTINILTLCYFAFVTFDPDISDIIEEVLSTKYILINDGSFDNMLKKYYPRIDIETDCYEIPSFNKNRVYKNDFIIITEWRDENGNSLIPIWLVLDKFLHELKHAMNSIINSYDNSQDGGFYCGLAQVDFSGSYYYRYLEEAFNSYIVYLYLGIIEMLKYKPITDLKLKELLANLNLDEYEYSYGNITKLLEPLFFNQEIFKLFYNAVLYKDSRTLVKVLEKIFGPNLYKSLDVGLREYHKGETNKLSQDINRSEYVRFAPEYSFGFKDIELIKLN